MRAVYDVKETFQASSAAEAVELLTAHPGAVLVAGGTDVMIRLKKRKLREAVLVSLQHLPELQNVVLEDNGTISIGAGCTFDELEHHPLLLEHVPMLADACHQVGSPQIRVMATIGGNLCNGAVSADSVPSLYALDAELELLGPAGTRRIPVCGFHTGPGRTVLGLNELLVRIRIPKASYEGHGGCYLKFGQRSAMAAFTPAVPKPMMHAVWLFLSLIFAPLTRTPGKARGRTLQTTCRPAGKTSCSSRIGCQTAARSNACS